jgi:two-component system cell cycle response regulator
LTGLNNRRFLERHLARLIDDARARRSPLALMIVDIDHFKRVNDTFGHDVGDEILKAFSQRLRAVIRAGDLLCRLGGEEFVMVLPGADSANAASIAERARLAIEQEDFAVASASRPLAITASIGLAEGGETQDWRELYRRADQALYRAKTEGRNRVNAAA